jgi:hypothetical protein
LSVRLAQRSFPVTLRRRKYNATAPPP